MKYSIKNEKLTVSVVSGDIHKNWEKLEYIRSYVSRNLCCANRRVKKKVLFSNLKEVD